MFGIDSISNRVLPPLAVLAFLKGIADCLLAVSPNPEKGRGEAACLILSIEIWLTEKEPPPDTHQRTALILRVS